MIIYEPLSEEVDSIRLLLLDPSRHVEDEICCHLKPVRVNGDTLTLQSGIEISYRLKYEALSYTWGDPLQIQHIFVNDQEIPIRSNLSDCLRRLCMPDTVRVLWIDALCINQDDISEKGRQISMMASTYNNAERVLAWLDETSDGSDELFCCINNLDQNCQRCEKEQYIPTDVMLQKRDDLFQRDYWNRTWIIQELHVAREVVFQTGDAVTTRTRFSKLFDDVWTNWLMTEREEQVKSLIDGQKLFDVNDTHLIDSHLPALIKRYGKTDCLDERDMVYALLNILPGNDRALSLKIDYSITAAQLYVQIFDLLKFDWPGDAWGEADALRRTLRLEWSQICAARNEIKPEEMFPWRTVVMEDCSHGQDSRA